MKYSIFFFLKKDSALGSQAVSRGMEGSMGGGVGKQVTAGCGLKSGETPMQVVDQLSSPRSTKRADTINSRVHKHPTQETKILSGEPRPQIIPTDNLPNTTMSVLGRQPGTQETRQ